MQQTYFNFALKLTHNISNQKNVGVLWKRSSYGLRLANKGEGSFLKRFTEYVCNHPNMVKGFLAESIWPDPHLRYVDACIPQLHFAQEFLDKSDRS